MVGSPMAPRPRRLGMKEPGAHVDLSLRSPEKYCPQGREPAVVLTRFLRAGPPFRLPDVSIDQNVPLFPEDFRHKVLIPATLANRAGLERLAGRLAAIPNDHVERLTLCQLHEMDGPKASATSEAPGSPPQSSRQP
jgi:hypothetical protein